MKNKLLFFGLLFSTLSYGQKAMVASGSDATSTSGNVSFSIGQIDFTSIATTSGSVNQGVQQPFEIVEVLSIPDREATFNATIFPNPAETSIIISLNVAVNFNDLKYEITDFQGKILVNGIIKKTETSVDVSNFAQTLYFVNIIKTNKIIKSFKLIKK